MTSVGQGGSSEGSDDLDQVKISGSEVQMKIWLYVVAASLIGGTLLGFSIYSASLSEYVTKLDERLAMAASQVEAPAMAKSLERWLADFEDLAIGARFNARRDTVVSLHADLLREHGSKSEAILDREECRERIAAVPHMAAEAHGASHSLLQTCALSWVGLLLLSTFSVLLVKWSLRREQSTSPEVGIRAESSGDCSSESSRGHARREVFIPVECGYYGCGTFWYPYM